MGKQVICRYFSRLSCNPRLPCVAFFPMSNAIVIALAISNTIALTEHAFEKLWKTYYIQISLGWKVKEYETREKT